MRASLVNPPEESTERKSSLKCFLKTCQQYFQLCFRCYYYKLVNELLMSYTAQPSEHELCFTVGYLPMILSYENCLPLQPSVALPLKFLLHLQTAFLPSFLQIALAPQEE